MGSKRNRSHTVELTLKSDVRKRTLDANARAETTNRMMYCATEEQNSLSKSTPHLRALVPEIKPLRARREGCLLAVQCASKLLCLHAPSASRRPQQLLPSLSCFSCCERGCNCLVASTGRCRRDEEEILAPGHVPSKRIARDWGDVDEATSPALLRPPSTRQRAPRKPTRKRHTESSSIRIRGGVSKHKRGKAATSSRTLGTYMPRDECIAAARHYISASADVQQAAVVQWGSAVDDAALRRRRDIHVQTRKQWPRTGQIAVHKADEIRQREDITNAASVAALLNACPEGTGDSDAPCGAAAVAHEQAAGLSPLTWGELALEFTRKHVAGLLQNMVGPAPQLGARPVLQLSSTSGLHWCACARISVIATDCDWLSTTAAAFVAVGCCT